MASLLCTEVQYIAYVPQATSHKPLKPQRIKVQLKSPYFISSRLRAYGLAFTYTYSGCRDSLDFLTPQSNAKRKEREKEKYPDISASM